MPQDVLFSFWASLLTPCFFFVSFHTKRALWVILPQSRHETVGKWTSQPPSHSRLMGVISCLSSPKAGKRNISHKQRAPQPRSHTNTPLRSCSWAKAASSAPPSPPFLPSLRKKVASKSPQSVRCGPLSCPASSAADKLSLI